MVNGLSQSQLLLVSLPPLLYQDQVMNSRPLPDLPLRLKQQLKLPEEDQVLSLTGFHKWLNQRSELAL